MAIRRRAEIGTRKVEYRGMTGRFNRWGFHKDRDAKNKYYPLEDYAVCCAKVIETDGRTPVKAPGKWRSNDGQMELFN